MVEQNSNNQKKKKKKKKKKKINAVSYVISLFVNI
jgi:hypothetical protein